MNDIQFAILRHAAGEGPAAPSDAADRRRLVQELGKAGLLYVHVPFPGKSRMSTIDEDTITFAGRCAYEAERDRRKAASLPHRAAVVAWEIVRTAGALFLGMVIGHSEGCVFGEQQESGRAAEQRADHEAGRNGGDDAAPGVLELPPQIDAGTGLVPKTGLHTGYLFAVRPEYVFDPELALPDLDGDEGGESRAPFVE